MIPYAGYTSSATAVAIATRGPNVLAAAAQATIEPAKSTAMAGSASAPPAKSSSGAVHDRRQRRTEEHRPRRDRIGVEELRVGEQVLVQVSADLERPGDGTHREDDKPDGEENDGAERAGGEPLEPCEGRGGPCLHRCHAPIA